MKLLRVSKAGSLRLAVLVCLAGGIATYAGPWAAKTPRLATPWTWQVSVENPLPEYPRPKLTRPEWQSLNGIWDFAVTGSDAGQPGDWPEQIRVPFPVESALSGIQRAVTPNDKLWYRRTFIVPDGWQGRRVQLNFGASDWQTTVWVNNQQIGGTHTGGYDNFGYDITDALNGGTNTIAVSVYDPTDAGEGALGKQRLYPVGIFYTAVSGIWQTVWLEPTPGPHLTRLDITPDLTNNSLRVTPRGAATDGYAILVTVASGSTVVGNATGQVDTELRVPIPNPRLWSPDDPYLYEVRAEVLEGDRVIDSVGSYAGMRSISLGLTGGVLRPMLNGSFVFQIGALDQGYWPDGIYTAPTDEALRFDLAKLKELGFNLVRKHIKVEPQRWYYWADRIGLMVWQDMPAMRSGISPSSGGRSQFEEELRRMISQLQSSPSIVAWVPFNEGWGEYDPARIADDVKRYDPSRLVSNNSGSNCCGFDGGNGDFIDDHVYVGPGATMPSGTRAAALGEYGGLGLIVPDHEWSPGASFSYENQASADMLLNRYVGLIDALRARMRLGLSVAIYTELTDVEGEVNGVLTYDRQVLKIPSERLFTAHDLLIRESRTTRVSLPANRLISFQVTTPGFTDRYLRHAYGFASTEVVTPASDGLLKQDATYWIRSGLADPTCVSFESRNTPSGFLRHQNFRLRIDANDGSPLFLADATFCPRGTGSRVQLESYNLQGSYLRHYDAVVYVARSDGPNPWDTPVLFDPDTTWDLVRPWWRSGADLQLDAALSLRVTTPGFTDRYLRHQYGLARTDIVDSDSPELLKEDATFVVRPGLAEGSCYSLESRNYPGNYLRQADFRVALNWNDGSALFLADATFCAGLADNGGVSFEALNVPGRMRHYDEAVYVATDDGTHLWDNPRSYIADTTWAVTAPWASLSSQSTGLHNTIR